MVALIALLGLSAIPACSSNIERGPSTSSGKTTSEHTGALGLQLTIGGGVTLTTINYTVSGNGITPITGSIPVGASGATASVLIGALPAGTGYQITLTGTDGTTTCQGSANFNVTAGQTVGVTVPLNCGAPTTRGNVRVDGKFNTCPEITSMIVAPLQVDAPTGTINVSAAGIDADPATTLTFAWTSAGGSFAAPAAASTSYLCSQSGTQTLTVTISDGAGCTTSLSADVLCSTSAICGDGNAETTKGEECDPPDGVLCDNKCHKIAVVCGNSIVQPTGGEQCDPPNNTTCSTTCKNIVCGDGKTEGAEQCDPPKAGSCDATCKNIPVVCGNGIVQPGEQCEPPNTLSCDAQCQSITCAPCAAANCSGPVAACQAHEPGCDNVLACIKASGCAVGSTRDAAECYCGALDNDTCFNSFDPSVPQGPCKDVINTAAGSTTPLQVGQVFFTTSNPAGAAMQTISCEIRSCKAECSL